MRIAEFAREHFWVDRKGRWILSLAILLTGVLFISYVLFSNWNQLQIVLIELNYFYVVLAFLLYPVGMLPTAVAWHTLLGAVGIQTGFRVNLRIYSLSCLPRNIPGFVWYIASRSLLYQEHGIPAGVITGVSLGETVLLALTGFALSVLPFFFLGVDLNRLGLISFAPILAIVLLCAVVLSVPTLTRFLQRILPKSKSNLVVLQASRNGLALSLIWMLLAWSGGGLLLFIVLQAVAPVGLGLLPTTIGIWGAAGGASLTVGIGVQGMGIREITLTALLSLVVPPLSAVVVAIAFRVILTAGEFFWALVFAGVSGAFGMGKTNAGT